MGYGMGHLIFRKRQLVLLIFLISLGSFWYLLQNIKALPPDVMSPEVGKRNGELQKVILGVVSCGGRYEEAMTMLRSAVLFSGGMSLHVVAIVDDETRQNFTDAITSLFEEALGASSFFTYEIKSTWFPPKNAGIWKKLYAPCSAQRIFFPSLLPKVDALLYVDSDTVFVSELRGIWNHFSKMDQTQWVGVTNEDEPTGDGWYNTKAEIPYFKPRGLNTGVLLLNLTRMRFYEAEQKAEKVLRLYGDKLYWGDQDIFNVMFSWNPEFVYILPCEYNFRPSHCFCRYNGSCSCGSAALQGVRIIHGNLQAFRKKGFFQSIYKAFQKQSLSQEKLSELNEELQKRYNNFWNSSDHKCVGSSHHFFKQLISWSS
ncbi:unnamed protein product [Allacma fusca]|uniref:Uncharacterized protein n=1 Tax=Allacma fusca TaxID=39272 RepID=A0A8J2K9Y3_9HEXA|nr:unnamed protein product [Allacma fusca]